MKRSKTTTKLICFLVFMFMLFAITWPANAEHSAWDCPECSRTGNTTNYCEGCAHPAPWLEPKPSTSSSYDAPAYVDQSADFEYRIKGSQAIITKYKGEGGTVFIPPSLGGKPVKTIPSLLFSKSIAHDFGTIKCVVIPEGVTKLENSVFYDNDLEEIYIPASVTSIGDEVFSYCSNLKSIHVDPENKKYTVVDDVLFTKSMDTLIVYPCGKNEKTYVVPEGVKTIGGGAFSDSKLETVILSNGVTSIGRTTFWSCLELKELTIPASVIKIDDLAFGSYNYEMTRIDVASDNKKFASIDGVLFDKGIKTLIQYPNGKDSVEYTIPDTVTSVNREAFGNSRYLKRITVSAKMKSIVDYQFYACDLESVTIPSGVTKIGDYAFGYSKNVHVFIPASVKSIGANTFFECTNPTIEGKKGSYAEKFASNNNIQFIEAE